MISYFVTDTQVILSLTDYPNEHSIVFIQGGVGKYINNKDVDYNTWKISNHSLALESIHFIVKPIVEQYLRGEISKEKLLLYLNDEMLQVYNLTIQMRKMFII